MAATNADSADVTLAWGVAPDTDAESVVSVSTPLERMDLAAVVDDLRRSEIDMVELFCCCWRWCSLVRFGVALCFMRANNEGGEEKKIGKES